MIPTSHHLDKAICKAQYRESFPPNFVELEEVFVDTVLIHHLSLEAFFVKPRKCNLRGIDCEPNRIVCTLL